MKKNIAYYLEDPERLSEISLHELNKWVEEMPYSQPLRLLVDMKSEKFVSTSGEGSSNYGLYFAEDYEPLSKKETKNLAEVNIEKIKTEDRAVESDESGSVGIEEIKEEESKPVIIPEVSDKVGNELPLVAHNLVDDFSEDALEDDLLEINPNVVVINEVSHEAADEVLEAELENEVLEITINEVEEVSSFSDLDEMMDVDNEEVAEIEVESIIDEVVEVDREDSKNDEVENDSKYAGLVDYKSFVVGVSDEEPEADGLVNEVTADSKLEEELEHLNKDHITEVSTEEEIEGAIVEVSKKEKKKSKKKKKKKKTKSERKKKESEKDIKLKLKKKKKKLKSKKTKDRKSVVAKSKKKKSKKSDSSKNKISVIKKVKGEIIKHNDPPKSKAVKGKAKRVKKEVKYVVVNEATTNDFKLKDYDGVSKFANWLLEQKSINGNLFEEKKQKEAVGAKKKDKKKKKNKKSKALKVAQDSVKKSEMILSEPLANIMAAQGHTKKAKKMYKQLGLIFPEKSGYFAAKIENLKKK